MSAVPMPPELALEEEPFPVAVLDDVLEGGGPEFHPDSYGGRAQRWQIIDDGGAEWALRRLSESDAALASLSEQATDWSTRITEWFEHRAKPLERRADFFRGHLHRYALARREAGDGATLTLPSGKVATIAGKARLEVHDDEAFLGWAADHPTHEAIRVRYELAKAEAMKLVQATGELPNGVSVVLGEPTAKVTVL